MIVKKGTDGEANEILLTGSFITTSETCDIIALGLRMVQGLVGDSAFSGRGVAGPLNIMTDDSDAEGGAGGQGGGGGMRCGHQHTGYCAPSTWARRRGGGYAM